MRVHQGLRVLMELMVFLDPRVQEDHLEMLGHVDHQGIVVLSDHLDHLAKMEQMVLQDPLGQMETMDYLCVDTTMIK